MVEASALGTGSTARQAALWGHGARAYAELGEGLMRALYREVLEELGVGDGVSMLDVGCGSGVAAALAVERGARVSGFDATPELLYFARKRVPAAEFRQGDMEQLPYPNDAFDVVTGFNSFQYAAHPVNALAEARRVAHPGGAVMIAAWGQPEQVDLAVVLKAFGSLMPPPLPGAPGPFALSQAGALATLVQQVGLEPQQEGRFVDRWELPDLDTTLRTLLSAGPAAAAIGHSGEDRVREAVAAAIAPFRTSTGGYRLDNEFAYLIARA